MAKFDKDGHMIEVVENLKSGKYLVRHVFTDAVDDWDVLSEYPGEGLSIVDMVFDSPPTKRLNQTVKELKEQIKDLQYDKQCLTKAIQEAVKIGKEKIAKYKKYDSLKNLDMFLDGKITHYVLEDWGSFKIISFEEAVPNKRYDKDQTKLLTLFGRSNGNLEWKLNKYSDGSGCYTTVTPCISLEEALEVAQRIVDSKMNLSHQCEELIKEAKRYDLKIAPEYIKKYQENEKVKTDAAIKELEKKLEALRSSKQNVKGSLFDSRLKCK